MQAVFRFSGDQEVVVSNQIDGVYVEIYEGIDPALFQDGKMSTAVDPDDFSKGNHLVDVPPRRQTLLRFKKADARSVASAIMGAAAAL